MLTLMTAHPNTAAPFAGVNATWTYTLGSIVFLFVMLDLIIVTQLLARWAETRSCMDLALVLLGVAAAATRIRYCWFLRSDSGSGWPHIGWTIALFAPAAASWVLAFAAGDSALFAAAQLWFSGVIFSLVAPRALRWRLIGAVFALTLAPLLARLFVVGTPVMQSGNGATFMVTFYAVLLPLMVISSLWFWRVVARLEEARLISAELAVTQERLRFAADLHDIQGHHLQVIALKAELVERTLAATPEYAAEQAGEIRLIAKEAMEETRSLVSGLREVELSEELENASEVLTLSGAECSLTVTAVPARVEAQRVLAFAVREATTNILRHSEATEAAITLERARGGYRLTVTNDGAGDAAGAAGAAGVADVAGAEIRGAFGAAGNARAGGASGGSGLQGLRERVAAVGGSLSAGTQPGRPGQPGETGESGESAAQRRFTLSVWVPEETAQ